MRVKKPKKMAKASIRDDNTKSPKSAASRVRAKATVPPMGTDRPGGRPNDLSWHPRFLATMAREPNISLACRAAGVDRKTARAHREKFPDFAAAWDAAEQASTDKLEAVAMRISTEGLKRLKFDKDGCAVKDPDTGKTYVEVEYPTALICFLLKGRRRDTYGDHVRVSGTLKTPPSDDEVADRGAKFESSLLATIRAAAGRN
jgi:hypothetical protein